MTSSDSMWQEMIWRDLCFEDGTDVVLFMDGKQVPCRSVTDLLRHRIATWASGEDSDRPLDNLNYGENLLLPSLKRISRRGVYKKNASYVLRDTAFFGRELSLHAPCPQSRTEQLELLTKRWEFFHPRAMLMWNVFSNADVEETEILKEFVQRMTRRGTAVLLLEVELRECLDISHEILLLRENGNVRIIVPEEVREAQK